MEYKFEFSKDAEDDIGRFDGSVARRILQKLVWFSKQDNPLRFAEHITDPVIGDLRFRIGDYRAVAVIDQRTGTIIIISVGHRRDIYRR